MISLKNILSKTSWEGREIELGKVYSNPYANAFKSIKEGDENTPEETLAGLKEMAMGDLERIADYANMIRTRMEEGQELDSWMYSQLTSAVDNLNAVHDAMDGSDGVKESVNEAPAQNTGEKIQKLNDRIRVLRAKITAQKDAVKRNELQQTLKNALQSLSNIKSNHGIKTEAKKYDIGAGYMGNGLTIWNREEEEHGDYRIIAHIDPHGKISIRDKQIPSNVMKTIEDWADAMKKGNK